MTESNAVVQCFDTGQQAKQGCLALAYFYRLMSSFQSREVEEGYALSITSRVTFEHWQCFQLLINSN